MKTASGTNYKKIGRVRSITTKNKDKTVKKFNNFRFDHEDISHLAIEIINLI